MGNKLLSHIHWFLQNSLWLYQAVSKCLAWSFLFCFLLEVIVSVLIKTICLMKFSAPHLILSLDTLKLYRIDNDTRTPITLIKKGIAWWTDKNVKFRNPTGDGNNLTALFQGKKRKNRNFKNGKMLQIPFDFSFDFKHILIAEFCLTDILLNVLNKCSLKKSKLRTTLLFERLSLSNKSCNFLVKVFRFYL